MSKFFPFPLLRGNIPRTLDAVFEEVPDDTNIEVVEDKRFKNLKPNKDLVHLVTAKCKADLKDEQQKKLIKGQTIRLTVKYSYKWVFTFRDGRGMRREEEVDVTSMASNTSPNALASRFKKSDEHFLFHTTMATMNFYDSAGNLVDLGTTARFWNMDLGRDDYFLDHSSVNFVNNSFGLDFPYLKFKDVCGLEHLVAYIWSDPKGSKSTKKESKKVASDISSSSDNIKTDMFGRKHIVSSILSAKTKDEQSRFSVKLSFYWDTAKPFSVTSENFEQYSERLHQGIFRFNKQFNSIMTRQYEMLLRVENKMRSRFAVPGEIRDVSDEEPHPNPEDFKLTLRDYQACSLTWMIRQENEPFALTSCILSSHDGRKAISLETGEPVTSNREQKLFGGILADNTGVGKTAVSLALMRARPLDRSRIPGADLKEYDDGNLIVKATLVICPSNLVNQWEMEYHKCIANGGKIIKITTIVQARRYKLKDIHEADMIIMSHSFLSNKNFFAQKNSLKVKYLALKYHRIVVDEFHELLDSMYTRTGEIRASSHVFQIFTELDAYSKFGLTGTPNYHLVQNIVRTGKILNIIVPNSKGYAALFKKHYVRRSVPDLQLPPIVYEQVDVVLKPVERAIYQSLGNNTRAAILLCSHFDMEQYEEARSKEAVEVLEDAAGNELLSVHDVAVKIQAGRKAAVERHTKDLEIAQKKLAKMWEKEDNYTQYDFATMTRKINSLTEEIANLNGEYAFFDNVLQTLKNRSEQECNICLNEFGKDDPVALTRCGHVFCDSCIVRSLKLKPMCPICRRPVAEKSVYKVSADEAKPEEEPVATLKISNFNNSGTSTSNPIVIDLISDDENQDPNAMSVDQVAATKQEIEEENEELLDQRFYGSKITKMAAYINDVLSNDSNARVLLFVQFTPLSKLVSSALNALGIQNSFVFGNIFARNNAIDKFRSNQVRVIMLSAETSVTGLQLTEATHVVLLHPFYFSDGQDDRATAAEKQGVARAYRLGLEHELRVVRFVVKNTVEEEILKDRPRLPI